MTRPAGNQLVKLSLAETRFWVWALFLGFSVLLIAGTELPVWVISISVLFALLGAVGVVCVGPVYIGRDAIWGTTPLGCYGMRWDEVTHVEYNPTGLVFHGKGKRFVTLGTAMWSKSEREKILPVLNGLVEEKGIRCQHSNRAEWLTTKNARFKRPNA